MLTPVINYLIKLRLPSRCPMLDYLNDLIQAHLHQIPYESYSKILDTERHIEFGCYLPPVELSNDRITSQGLGGTCWVLARSFAWLLSNLGFDAALVYMDPGHLCVRVDIGGIPYYVDVGYGAPLFKAFPMSQSFMIEAPSERFAFSVTGNGAMVVRTPGPSKFLAFEKRQIGEITEMIAFANRWETSRHLKIPTVSKFVDGRFVRLIWNTLKDWRCGELQETLLTDNQVSQLLPEVFGVDPRHFFLTRELLARRGINEETRV